MVGERVVGGGGGDGRVVRMVMGRDLDFDEGFWG